jgi:hypothetical protein
MAGYEMQKPNSSLANHGAFPTVEPVPSVPLPIHQLGSQNDQLGKAYT